MTQHRWIFLKRWRAFDHLVFRWGFQQHALLERMPHRQREMHFTSVFSESRKWNSGHYPACQMHYLREYKFGVEPSLESAIYSGIFNFLAGLRGNILSSPM